MRWLRAWFEKRDAELDREIESHLELEAEEREEGGATAEEARYTAQRAFGNIAMTKEDVRAVWAWTRLEQLARDVRFGLRQIRRNPGFSAIAIATLALGIGGVTAVFSAFDAVLIRPLPYADADRLVTIWDDLSQSGDQPKHNPAPAEWLEWRRLNTVFTDTALTEPATATLSGDSGPEQAAARKATANLWSVLGVKPQIGRVFTEEEDEKGLLVAVISHGLWQRRYGGSSDVLGRKILVNDKPYELIGVMPPDFYFLPSRDIDLWMPASFPEWMRKHFSWHSAQVVARLKPGVTLESARASMEVLSLNLTAKDFRGPHSVVVLPLREDLVGKTQTALVVLLCASAALLLIACVNLANLLLSRGAARGREVAVRTALGAGRGRLIAQFFAESLALAGSGALAGLALAVPAIRFLALLVPETMGAIRLQLDWRVLAFSAGTAVTAALAFGLLPGLRASRLVSQGALRESGRGAAGARSHWFQHSLVIVETALAVALLTSGGLLLQTIQHLQNTDLGLKRENLLSLEMPLFRYRDHEKRVGFVDAVLQRIRAIPGVIDAGASSQLPLQENDAAATFYWLPGQPKDMVSGQVALFRFVTRDYFPTIGARLREGRFFETSDPRSESQKVIVNETFANRHFPEHSAVGARFKLGNTNEKGYWYTVVGVVKEVREVGMAEALRPTVYCLHEQANDQLMVPPSGVVIRTTAEPTSIVSSVRQAIWSVDENQPIWRIQTLEDILDRQLSTPSQSTALLSAFALLALLLASLGLYGVLSYAVAQRTSEIGVRMALGATSKDILLSFGRRGLALAVAGLAIGIVLAAITARSMSALLYGFQPDYVPAVSIVSLILLVVAGFACLIPARRASKIDPMAAVQHE